HTGSAILWCHRPTAGPRGVFQGGRDRVQPWIPKPAPGVGDAGDPPERVVAAVLLDKPDRALAVDLDSADGGREVCPHRVDAREYGGETRNPGAGRALDGGSPELRHALEAVIVARRQVPPTERRAES